MDYLYSKEKAPLIVEFFGLSGAGKTTIANEVVKQLERANIKTASPEAFLKFRQVAKKQQRWVSYLLNYSTWKLICNIKLRYLLKNRVGKWFEPSKYRVDLARYTDEFLGEYEVLVFDQLTVQGICSFAWRFDLSLDSFGRMFDNFLLFSPRHVLVYTLLDHEIAESRSQARDKPAIEAGANPLSFFGSYVDFAQKDLKRRKSIDLICINTKDSVTINVKRILNHIKENYGIPTN